MKVSCVIPSAGKGRRLKAKQDKAFIRIKNKPIIFYTIKALERCSLINEIIAVVSRKNLAICAKLVKKHKFRKVTQITSGGKKRFDSVRKGLQKIKDAHIILIHDGARPFIDEASVKRVIDAVKKYGAALAALPSKQTLKVVNKKFLIQKTLFLSLLPVGQVLWKRL